MNELEIIAESFTEVKLDGKMRKIGKLTIGDWADMQAYKKQKWQAAAKLRKQEICETAKDMYPDGVPESIFDKAMKPPTEDELESSLDDSETMTFLLWCAMKKFNPDMAMDEAGALVTFENLTAITEAIIPQVDEKKTPQVAESQ